MLFPCQSATSPPSACLIIQPPAGIGQGCRQNDNERIGMTTAVLPRRLSFPASDQSPILWVPAQEGRHSCLPCLAYSVGRQTGMSAPPLLLPKNMTDPNSPSHWDALASDLGATPPTEEAEPQPSSPPPSQPVTPPKSAPRAPRDKRPSSGPASGRQLGLDRQRTRRDARSAARRAGGRGQGCGRCRSHPRGTRPAEFARAGKGAGTSGGLAQLLRRVIRFRGAVRFAGVVGNAGCGRAAQGEGVRGA